MLTDYLFPVQAIHADGTVVLFEDAGALCCGVRLNSVGDHHFICAPNGDGKLAATPCADWVLRDDSGTPVDVNRVHDCRRAMAGGGYIWRRDEAQRHAASLGLPIPRTGKRRWGRYHGFRKTRFKSVYTAESALDADLRDPELTEMRRFLRVVWEDLPPNDYDDVSRSDAQKCWKSQRRTHWRARG